MRQQKEQVAKLQAYRGLAEVRRRVHEIDGVRLTDAEAAHAFEDVLYEDVLRAIAEWSYGDEAGSALRRVRKLARLALKSKQLAFRRDCA